MSEPDATPPPSNPSPGGEGSRPPDATLAGLTDSQIQAALTPAGTDSTRTTSSRGWQPPSVEELQRLLPQYEVRQFVARGGMGAVYKGWQKSLDRFVAIKVLPPDIDDEDVHYAERFKQEAKAMAKLKHPGIASVYDAGETAGGLLYFIMEFIEGSDVAQLVAAQGKLPVERALSITRHVCDALAYAHGRGVVHRDIKPSNIMLETDGTVKVADFGLAKVVTQESGGFTRSDISLGTPDFIAPEALIAGIKVDARADLYAVGVMLYQMLTGIIPRGRFKLPSGVVPNIDPRLDAIVDKAMQTDREHRYSTALELKTAVDEVAQSFSSHEARAAKAKAAESPSHSRQGLRSCEANPMTAWLIAVAVVAFIVGGWVFWKAGHRDKKEFVAGQKMEPTAPEPNAIRLWDAPERILKKEGATWENDSLHLDNAMLVSPDPLYFNASLRALIKLNPEARAPGISLRGFSDAKGDLRYSLSLEPTRRVIQLQIFFETDRTVLREWPYPRDYGAEEWARLELRVVGDELTASIDGKVLGTHHDSTLMQPGRAQVYAKQAGYFRDIVLVPLDKAVAAQPAGRVVKLLPLVDVKRDAINSGWSAAPEGAVRSQRERKAGRLEFPYSPPAEYDFEIEFTVEEGNSGYVMQVLAVPGHWLEWRMLPPPAFGPALDGVEPGSGPRTEGIGQLFRLKPGDRHRSVVEVRTNSVRALVDGQEIARFAGDLKRLSDPTGFFKLRDTSHLGVAVLDIGLLIHKAVVREITGAGKVDATGGADDSLKKNIEIPAITNWQDLTETVREKARNIPNLIVEPGLIRHTGSGPQVSFPISKPGVRDYAVRLRFTSDGQIDLRSSAAGFIYVLCQHEKTVFHRYEAGASAPVLLHPNVPNPADFDFRPTHEMLVTMQGPTIRGWLDGRFVGEAQDTTFQDGEARLLFTISTMMQKVEVAELTASPMADENDFRPLFDGKSLDEWLALNGDAPPAGWRIIDGSMTGRPHTCVMTREEFGDFDLRLEWRVNPQGNGGVFYRVAEDEMVERPMKAVEFNLMDEGISAPPVKQSGAAFDVKAPSEKAAHPAGEWNTARLLVQGTRVEHWINDKLVCRYDLADPAVAAALESAGIGGGFKGVKKGRITLQSWTGEVFYRNVRLREITPAAKP